MNLRDCFFPWCELNLSYDHRLRCCCYYSEVMKTWDFTQSLDFNSFWNGEAMQKIRNVILSNSQEGTGCKGCIYIKYYEKHSYMSVPTNLNSLQTENWNRAIENFRSGNTVIDTVPIRYYFNFGLACNINCIMCSQKSMRVNNKETLPHEKLLELKEYLLPANEFSIIGGEPFFIPEARKFLDAMIADKDYEDNLLSFFTNGTLLHEYVDKLRSIKRVNVTISLDSIGDAYEHIRRGSTWNLIEKNIDLFKSIANTEHLDWTVHASAIVMKSSLTRIDEFVDWCIGRDVPVHFVPLIATGTTSEEDIYNNHSLLDQVPGWVNKIDNAINKLEQKGWINGGAAPLRELKNQLIGS